jgi:hypothetical protein
MVKIKKSNYWRIIHSVEGTHYEEFDSKKIEMALIKAGARGPMVEEIAALAKPFEGMTTEEIESIVLKELEKRDPATAKHWKTKRDYQRNRFKI